jgi:hypothetical protein
VLSKAYGVASRSTRGAISLAPRLQPGDCRPWLINVRQALACRRDSQHSAMILPVTSHIESSQARRQAEACRTWMSQVYCCRLNGLRFHVHPRSRTKVTVPVRSFCVFRDIQCPYLGTEAVWSNVANYRTLRGSAGSRRQLSRKVGNASYSVSLRIPRYRAGFCT